MTQSAIYHVTLFSAVISALEEDLTISIEGNTHQEKITYHFIQEDDVKKGKVNTFILILLVLIHGKNISYYR